MIISYKRLCLALIAAARAITAQRLPLNVVVCEGDLLEAKEDVIAHQCNCVSKHGKGLADVLFSRLPYADVYADRRSGVVKAHTPGTVIVRGDGRVGPRVANIFSQYKGGKPSFDHNDTAMNRVLWFRQGLQSLPASVPGLSSVALPHNIGCGLAGGDWTVYLAEIAKFAASNPSVRVVIYQLKDAAGVGSAEPTAAEAGAAAAAKAGDY